MKLTFELIFFVIILSGATFLVLGNLPLSSHGAVFGFSTSSIYMFVMLNTVLWAVLVKSVGPSAEGSDDFMPFLQSVQTVCEEQEQTEEKIDKHGSESSTDSPDYQSDSSDTEDYEEEDESDGNDEHDWSNEYDDTLNSRVEEFIAKVIKGWREEQMEENLRIKQVD